MNNGGVDVVEGDDVVVADVETWGNRIAGSLLGLSATFATAEEIRHRLAGEGTRTMTARTLLDTEQ